MSNRQNIYAMRRQGREHWKAALPFVIALVFFLAVCLSSLETSRTTALVLSLCALAAILFRFQALRERLFLPLILLGLVVLMDGVSTLYAVSGKFALNEFLKVLTSFCLVLLLLAFAPGRDGQPGNWIATVLAVCTGLGSLVSIDLLSTRWISGAILWFLSLFTSDYAGLTGVEAGVRMNSLFTNPNVFAGFAGLGVLLSLGLAASAGERKKRLLLLPLLYVNSLGFLLAFSMGASAFIAFAFLMFLALERKERRAGLLVLMLETFTLVAVSAALVSATSLQAWGGVQPVPLACALLGAAALCALDRFIGEPVAEKLKGRGGKIVLILICALVAVLVVFVFAALRWTGGVTLQSGGTLRRAAYPEEGTYTLQINADGPLNVRIESQNRQETMMHTETVLYRGAADGAEFTVPEDSLVVYFNFSAPEGARFESAFYEGNAGDGKIPLGYKLLPGFIANRLQGLFANENAIQRLVFFDDGMKLFRRSPIVGLGMGAFENGVKSVQSFYYETKYAHDHYIQTLVETGVVGLLLFVALLAGSAVAVWFGKKAHPLAPALGAALVFMAGHAVTEVVFSSYAYLPMAFGAFALIDLCCGAAVPKIELGKALKTASLSVTAASITAFAVLLGLNMSAKRTVAKSATPDTIAQAVSLDKFEWADYALSFVNFAAENSEDPAIVEQADEYALRLAGVDSNTIPLFLAQYYFITQRTAMGMEMLEKYVNYVSSDAAAWQSAFSLMRSYEQGGEDYRDGVARIARILEEWNAENLGDITLDEETQAFIARYSG